MKSYFLMTQARGPHQHGAVGGTCACQSRLKLELQVADDSLDFLTSFGFKTKDDTEGSCSICGRNIAFRRLIISSVEDLRAEA